MFEARGGGVLCTPGMRLMASGLPHPQWNTGDVSDDRASVDVARAWYAERGVAWGLRVAPGVSWPYGRLLLSLRLMCVMPSALVRGRVPSGVTLRTAGPSDVEAVLAADTAAFGSDPGLSRPWTTALVESREDRITVCVASVDADVVGTGYAVYTDGLAGKSVYLAGIAVMPGYRNRGIGGAISTWLVCRGMDAGAELAHLSADDDRAARLYTRLGFAEAGVLDVYGEM